MQGVIEDFDQCYRAVRSKDARFDGWFVIAVTSTGIYCRPSCPAMTPKRANVRFLPTAAAAQRAGFRACKRCRPDASPGSPEWNLRADAVGRAMRLIRDGAVEREGVTGLARRLGVSERHLHRQLVAELGAGPLALARAQRAQTARLLIETTTLPFTDVAFAAGFPSIRQFNETVREVFATTPTELRRGAASESRNGAGPSGRAAPARTNGASPDPGHANGAAPLGAAAGTGHANGAAPLGAAAGTGHANGAAPLGASAGTGHPNGAAPLGAPPALTLRLRHRAPLDAAGLLAFLGARAVPGVEAWDPTGGGTYRRVLALPHGPGVATLGAGEPGRDHVRCELRLSDLRDLAAAVQRCRRLLDLDADPVAIDDALAADPLLAPLVRRAPGRRVPGAVDGAELAVRAVLGQQVSVAGARTLAGRLTAALGEPLPDGLAEAGVATGLRAGGAGADRQERAGSPPSGPVAGRLTHAFPTAHALAAADPAELPLTRARAHALTALCSMIADGSLALDPGADRDATRERLLTLPGIGPWTAEYVAMRALGDPDAFPATDLGVRKAIERLGRAADPDGWRPWRAYAVQHLWASLSEGGTT